MPRLSVILFSILLTACDTASQQQALGTLERDRIVLRATAAEVITAQPVTEGSLVSPSQILVQLDDRRQRAVLAQAEADVAQATAVLSRLRNGARAEDIDAARSRLRQAQAELDDAEKQLRRQQALFTDQLGSASARDAALARRDRARAATQEMREQLLLLTNGSRAEDLAQAEAQLAAAEARRDLERLKLEDLDIVATRPAVLDSLPSHVGERVRTGDPIAVLLADVAPYARVYLPINKRAGVTVGASMLVHVDGIDKPFDGTLRWVSMDPAFTPHFALTEKERSRLVYLAEIQLPAEARGLASGLPAQVDLP